MGEKNQSHISRGSNHKQDDNGRSKSCGSHHDQNPRRIRRKRRRKTNKQEEDQDEQQTLEIGEDRISELPDSLLIHILSLLPALDQVIRTGTLSKRWLHLWTFVPNLLFTPIGTSSHDACEKFVSDVNRTLNQSRVSKIDKFSILSPYRASFASNVDSWLHFVTKNNVDHLTLGFSDMIAGEDYFLPQHFYSNLSLKILKLTNCIIAPVGLISWKSLKRLCLKYICQSNGMMEGILSGCPVLEILEVRNYWGFNRLKVNSPSLRELVLSNFQDPFEEDDDDDNDNAYLEISAPNLHTLTISSRFYTWNVRLEDVTSLVSADLSFYLDMVDIHDGPVYDDDEDDVNEMYHYYDKYLDLLEGLIEKLHRVEELKLATWCIQVLSTLEVRGLPSPLLNCKSLTLDMHIVDTDQPGLARLLDICPYLETLVMSTETLSPSEFFVGLLLYKAYCFDDVIVTNYFQSRKKIPECLLLHLKKVKIFGFRKTRFEVELVQFLIKNCQVLDKLYVCMQREDFQCRGCCLGQKIFDEEFSLLVSSPNVNFISVYSEEELVDAMK